MSSITWFSAPSVPLVSAASLGFLIVSLAATLPSPSPASATGVYIPYLGVTMNTSSLAGRFDFGIGMKSLRSPEELLGRKWEEGCSNNRVGFFFLHSCGFFVGGLLVIGEVGGRVVVVVVNLSVVVGTVVVLTVVCLSGKTVTLWAIELKALNSPSPPPASNRLPEDSASPSTDPSSIAS